MGAYALSNYLIRATLVSWRLQFRRIDKYHHPCIKATQVGQNGHPTSERRVKGYNIIFFFHGIFYEQYMCWFDCFKIWGQLTLKVACCAWSTMTLLFRMSLIFHTRQAFTYLSTYYFWGFHAHQYFQRHKSFFQSTRMPKIEQPR